MRANTGPTIPPSTPDITNDNGLQSVLDDVLSGSTDVTGAVNAGAAKARATEATGTDEEPWVLRSRTVAPNDTFWARRGLSPEMMKPKVSNKPDALTAFEGEFAKNIEDPGFQSWLVTRGWAFGKDLITKDGRFNAAAGRTFWDWLGEVVANNPDVQRSVTPEQYADGRYAALGGDEGFIAAGGTATDSAAAPEIEQNPITTLTQVNRTTMNAGSANAAVDDLARGLLGRMASEKEMARYRKAINSFLAKNPSVSTMTRDATDPDNVKMNTVTKDGASAQDAVSMLEMRLRRGSEGMAFNAGKMIEDAIAGMKSKEV